MTFKGRLLLASLMLKLFFGRKFPSAVEIWPQNGGFFGRGKGGVNVRFWFCDPWKYILAQNRVFWRFASMSVVASWL